MPYFTTTCQHMGHRSAWLDLARLQIFTGCSRNLRGWIWMKAYTIALVVYLAAVSAARAVEEKPLLAVTPSAAELGGKWTTNVIAYLLDPRSQPPEIDYRGEASTSLFLAAQREVM